MARLIIAPRNRGVRQFNITGPVTTIGRADANKVQIAGDLVSRHHAAIEWIEEGGYIITDLGSRNGTYVNDERIRTRPLHSGDTIVIGDCQMRFLWAGLGTHHADNLRLLTIPGEPIALGLPTLSPDRRNGATANQSVFKTPA